MISAIIITVVSEVSRKTGYIGGLIASLPLTSILALFWLYNDTRDVEKVAELSTGILLFVFLSHIASCVLISREVLRVSAHAASCTFLNIPLHSSNSAVLLQAWFLPSASVQVLGIRFAQGFHFVLILQR